jgi:hypothetical protein
VIRRARTIATPDASDLDARLALLRAALKAHGESEWLKRRLAAIRGQLLIAFDAEFGNRRRR